MIAITQMTKAKNRPLQIVDIVMVSKWDVLNLLSISDAMDFSSLNRVDKF